jgi:hypothetical protein
MCAKQSGHRFTTTTTGDADDYIAEPASGQPVLTAAQAYAHFVDLYGRQKPAERRATQVRYGLITDDDLLFASASLLEAQPTVVRTPGWMITNCAAPTHPLRAYGLENHPGRPGDLMFSVADTTDTSSLGWSYEYKADNGTTYGTFGGGLIIDPDDPSSAIYRARYYSVPWTLVKRGPHDRKLLIRYLQLPCYSLDHLNVDQDVDAQHDDFITVILSTGAHGSCAKPSAISPYMEAVAYAGEFGTLRHNTVGPTTFEGITFGGTGTVSDERVVARAWKVAAPSH